MDNKENIFVINPTNNMTKYILPLDNIDFNLMPRKLYESRKTLFRGHEDEYQTFEIYMESIGSAGDDITTCQCHICAVEVPLMFFQKHLSSAKHVTLARLAASALKRLQSQLLQPAPQIEQPINSIHYCESCSVAVKFSNRNEHELTSQHVDFVRKDELLKQLHDLYVNSDDEEYNNTATSIKNTKSDSEIAVNVTGSDISNLTINNQYSSKMQTKSYADATFASKSVNINDENHKSFDEKIDKNGNKNITNNVDYKNGDKYLKAGKRDVIITKQKHDVKLKVVNCEGRTMHYVTYRNDLLEIEALSGAKAIVPPDNYHGFSGSKGNIHCKVCRKMVMDKDWHKYEEEHLINIRRPIEDENFYRQLADGYNHCIFCNEIVGEIGFHILVSRQHHTNITKSKNKIRRTLKLRKNSIYCDICHEDIVNVKEHKKRPSHKMNVQQKVFELTKIEKFKPVNYQFKRNSFENIILCQVCNIVVPEGNIEEHLNDSKHNSKYKALLKANNIVKTGDMINCEVCQSTMFPTQEINHIISKKHINNLKSFTYETPKNVLQVTENLQNTVIENLSPLDVPGPSNTNKWKSVKSSDKVDDYDSLSSSLHSLATIEDIYDLDIENDKAKDADSDTECIDSIKVAGSDTESMNSKDAIEDIYDLDKENNKAIDADSDTECIDSKDDINVEILFKQYFCDVCTVYLPFDKQSVAKHKSNSEHKEALDRRIAFFVTYQFVIIHLNKQTLKPLWFCKVCSFDVNNPNAHVREANHKLKYYKLLSENFLIKQNDKLFLCNVCNSFVEMGEELNHIYEVIHLSKVRFSIISNENSNYNESFDNNSSTHSSVETMCSSVNSKENQIDIKNTLSNLKPRLLLGNGNEDSNKLPFHTCAICNVKVPNNAFSIEEHETGNYHKQKAVSLKSNDASEGKEYTCSVGNVIVPNILDNIRSHENGIKHQKKLNELNKTSAETKEQSYLCTVCNVSITNNTDNIRTHEMGSLHRQKLNGLRQTKDTEMNKQHHLCTICNIFVPSNSKNIKSHEMGALHAQKLNEVTQTNTKAHKCTICNVFVPNNSKNIRSHEMGALHAQKLNEVTQTNTKAHKCTICNVFVPNNSKNIRSHEMGTLHAQKLNEVTQTNTKAHKCTICNVFVPNNSKNIRSHEMGALHAQKLNEVTQTKDKKLHEVIQTKDTTLKKQPYKCNICNVTLLQHNIKIHEKCKLHKQKLQELMKVSKI